MEIYAYATVWVVVMLIAGYIAGVKGRSTTEAAILAFLLGPLGLIIEAMLPDRPLRDLPVWRVCPMCAERVRVQAKVCRYCGHELSSLRQSGHPTVGRASDGEPDSL